MEQLIKYLENGGSFVTILVVIVILFAVVEWCYKVFKFTKDKMDTYAKKKTNKEKLNNDINNLTDRVDKEEEHIDEIYELLQRLIASLDADMQVIHRRTIKEFYEKAIRQQGILTEKDMKDYHSALDCYNAHHGNSYVHDEIMPYMQKVKVVLLESDIPKN